MDGGEGEAPGGTYTPAALRGLAATLHAGLPAWRVSPGSDVTLINISENATYRVDDPAAGAPLVVRLYRRGYHSDAEIASELAWIEALRQQGTVDTPAPLRGRDGEILQVLTAADGGPPCRAAAFAFVPGRAPDAGDDLPLWFARLGGITARLHLQARRWQRPGGFRRKTWNVETAIGAAGHWGDWRAGPGLDAQGRALLGRAAALVAGRLARFGTGPDRFGLVHADLRLANLLLDGDALTVLDFDDCGFGWFAYDFAAAVSFFEHDPVVPALMQAWVEGYRQVAPLDAASVAELPVLVMLRRLLLLAWIASHAETPTAQELGVPYSEATLPMAEDLLRRYG